MPHALVVSARDLGPELGRTILWRSDIERSRVPGPEQAVEAIHRLKPNLVLLDASDPEAAAAFVGRVRADPELRATAIVVLTRAGAPMLTDARITPFTEFEFMRRALAAVIALSHGGAPIGVFLMLRRMSLVGDAMAHAILPGAAIGFLLSGLNLFAMTTGGLIAGFAVALLAGLVARTTELKEDASLATFYLVSLALGVTIVSIKGTNIDLLHVLFGNILAMDDQTLLVIAFNATLTLLGLAVIYRPLVIECVDPVFLRTVSRAGAPAHLAFLALVGVNLSILELAGVGGALFSGTASDRLVES